MGRELALSSNAQTTSIWSQSRISCMPRYSLVSVSAAYALQISQHGRSRAHRRPSGGMQLLGVEDPRSRSHARRQKTASRITQGAYAFRMCTLCTNIFEGEDELVKHLIDFHMASRRDQTALHSQQERTRATTRGTPTYRCGRVQLPNQHAAVGFFGEIVPESLAHVAPSTRARTSSLSSGDPK